MDALRHRYPLTICRTKPKILTAEDAEVRREINLNEISGQVVDAAMKVHAALGPGLLENSYEACLKHELEKRGLRTEQQVGLPVEYDGVRIDLGYRLDLLVENQIIS
jgi:hypothetical protein